MAPVQITTLASGERVESYSWEIYLDVRDLKNSILSIPWFTEGCLSNLSNRAKVDYNQGYFMFTIPPPESEKDKKFLPPRMDKVAAHVVVATRSDNSRRPEETMIPLDLKSHGVTAWSTGTSEVYVAKYVHPVVDGDKRLVESTLHVSIKIIQAPIHTPKKEVLPEVRVIVPNREKRSRLYDLLPAEFNSSELSDFKLVCQDETFLCHKLILGVGSPVFKGMFQSGAKEVTESEVRIEDVEKDLLKLMLEWMYGTDIAVKIQGGIQQRMGLYRLADRYLVDPLKESLAVEILFSVTAESAFDVYKLGEACGEERFKTKAMEIMKRDKERVFANDEIFEECCKQFPEVLQIIVTGN